MGPPTSGFTWPSEKEHLKHSQTGTDVAIRWNVGRSRHGFVQRVRFFSDSSPFSSTIWDNIFSNFFQASWVDANPRCAFWGIGFCNASIQSGMIC